MFRRRRFSWKRASGLSAAKSRLSRQIGVPLTRSGRRRKFRRLLGNAFLGQAGTTSNFQPQSTAAGLGCLGVLLGCGCLLAPVMLCAGLWNPESTPQSERSTLHGERSAYNDEQPPVSADTRLPASEVQPEAAIPSPAPRETSAAEAAPAEKAATAEAEQPTEPQSSSVARGTEHLRIPSSITARVSRVIDGDSIRVLADDHLLVVHLDAIDSPENGQPYAGQASAALSRLVRGKEVRIDLVGRNTDGELIGRVWLENKSVNRLQVEAGWAWYVRDAANSAALAGAEQHAREAHLGLWAQANPEAPWTWRESQPVAPLAPKLFPKQAAPQSKPAPVLEPVPPRQDEVEEQTRTHWLTKSSGVRHNRGCRYFQNSNGRYCSPHEGRACKVCGG